MNIDEMPSDQPKHDDGGPAFPMHERDDALSGMSLLDWFAGKELEAMGTESFLPREDRRTQARAKAVWAYEVADVMIEEKRRREKAAH